MTNPPSTSTPHHFQPSSAPSSWPAAQSTAIGTTDHRYTRARFNRPTSPYSHVQPNAHTTRWRPDHDVVGRKPTSRMSPPRSASPEVSSPDSQSRHQVDHGIGPSSLPDKEQTSSPMTSSPHTVFHSTEFTQQPTFEQKSAESHSSKKRHKCDVCGSYWGRPSSLKIHMVSHTGVKGMSCQIFPLATKLISAVQNSSVPSASRTSGSNRIIPGTSESTTRTRVKDLRPGLLDGGGVGRAAIRTLDPYDS